MKYERIRVDEIPKTRWLGHIKEEAQEIIDELTARPIAVGQVLKICVEETVAIEEKNAIGRYTGFAKTAIKRLALVSPNVYRVNTRGKNVYVTRTG